MSTLSMSEFSTTTQQAASQVASGWSEAASRYATWVTTQEASRVLTATEKFNAFASELGTSYRTAAEKATVWAQAARDAGRTGVADIMTKYADKYAGQADRLLNTMLDQKANLNLLAAEARTAALQAEAALGGGFARAVGPAFDAYQMVDGALEWGRTGNSDKYGGACMGVLLSAGFGLFAASVVVGAPMIIAVTFVAAAAAIGSAMGDWMYTNFRDAIDSLVDTYFTSARNWVPRRDPLVLDLNGGGITTSGINPQSPLYFDHAGDGLPNATGWVGAGEGLVVRDLNGNGLIDSGRELFGDNTVLTSGPNAGKNATDGFDALRDLDSNADGKFDASDAAFSSVKIWTDANGDAISQTTELHSFADLGLQSISLTASATNINLVDSNGAATGNTQTFAGSFTRVGGGVGAAATADLVGNLLLSSNNFYRQFSDDPALTPTCGQARRASVPTGLRARGRGAWGTRLNLHQQRGLRSVSVAAANWRRPTGTATRHACGGAWRGNRNDQARNVHFTRCAGQKWPGRSIRVGSSGLHKSGLPIASSTPLMGCVQ